MRTQTFMTGILTKRSLKKNKGRNLVAVLAIIMTTMMFTTLFTLAQSMEKNVTQMYLYQSGTCSHTSCKSITDEQIEQISSHPDVAESGKSIVAGLAENQSLAGRQVEIRYGDEQYAEFCFGKPSVGMMPKKKDEIALDTLILERLGIPSELGQQVTLEWKKDIHSEEITVSTFTLCGFWEGNLSSYASMAWVSEEFVMEACGGADSAAEGQSLGMRMMSLSFADSKNIEEKMAKVLDDCGLSGLDFQENLTYTDEMRQSIRQETLPMYAGMALVFIAGYLIIFNVFQISVASDIQFYGKLKTLGMTTKQIRRMILGQGGILSVMGIPAGILLGYLLGIVLLPVLISVEDMDAIVSVNPVIFIGSALFALATVMISCLLPARLAGKVSPMEALKYTDADSNIKRKSKKSENGASLYRMAWANLWRNRKRTVLVILSLSLGLVLTSFFYAKNASYDVEKYLLELAAADFQIDDATNERISGYDPGSQTISKELVADIQDLPGIEESGSLYSREVSMPLSLHACDNLRAFYTEEALEEFESYDPTFPQWKERFDEALEGKAAVHTVYGADGVILEAAASKNYILSGEYDAEEFATGKYILAISTGAMADAGDSEEELPTYSAGEKIQIENQEFTVMAVLNPLQSMVKGQRAAFDIPLIIPAEAYTRLWPESNLRKFYFNVDDAHMEEASNLLKEYQQSESAGMNIVSRKSIEEQYEENTRSAAVMGYSISVVIALVGILNYINSMVTAIISRKKEFAMIQSVGMTKRQLRRMLAFEGIFYVGITLVVSYILSALTVGVIVRALVADGYSTFRFTLLPLVGCTPVLAILAVLIPYICFWNLEKQSVVERLRTAE